MKRFLLLALTAGLISFPAKVLAGPFGLEMGESLESIKKKGIKATSQDGGDGYELERLPKSSKKFYRYSGFILPENGLCQITAVTNIIDSSGYGNELRMEFNEIEDALIKKYGKNLKVDELRSGSILKKPVYWMMSLRDGERYFYSRWTKENGSNLPEEINIIDLEAKATRIDRGAVLVRYWSSNFDSCREENTERNTDNL